MNQNLLEHIKGTIEKLESERRLENARIFLFGMNTPGDRIIQYLASLGYSVECILDNNPKNQGQTLLGVKVCPPHVLQGEDPDNIRILIASRYYREMRAQLEEMGYREDSNIIKLIEFESGINVSDSEEVFEQAAGRLRQCAEVYKQVTDGYDESTHFLLCPIRANGDMYIAASLMQSIRIKEGIENLYLITVGGIGRKIAAMFGEDKVIAVSQEQMDALVHIAGVMGKALTGMHVFYPKAFSYGIFANMECYKGLNYMDLTAGGMLGLDMQTLKRTKARQAAEDDDAANSSRHTGSRESDKRQGRPCAGLGYVRLNAEDILLAPYANSLPCFNQEFWERLVQALKAEGYNVYTNSDGGMEPVIAGTKPLFLPIQDMASELGRCAGFIAIRNGLCDVVSEAECRKIILYPDKGMGFGSVLDFYGLNTMGMCRDAVEIVYSEKRENEIIEGIINVFITGD